VKKLAYYSITLLILATLAYSSNRIVAHVLDAQLPGLLSQALGIPVHLGPTRVNLARLTAHSPKLVMGDPTDPAIAATDLSVTLHWSDLLRAQLRLREGSASTLAVNPARWPTNNDPWPTDYSFLDPYLPDLLQLETGHFIDPDGSAYHVAHARWKRTDGGATLGWEQTWSGKPLTIEARLASLGDVLRLAGAGLDTTITAGTDKDSRITTKFTLAPGSASGYQLSAQVGAAGMLASITSDSEEDWVLPPTSTTHMELLDIGKLQALLNHYSPAPDASGTAGGALPLIALPDHTGQIKIDELRWRDQAGANTVIEYKTGGGGFHLPSFTIAGEGGILNGHASLESSARGWQVNLNAAIATATAEHGLAAAYLDSAWSWHSGRAVITGAGDNWTSLLNSLQGEVDLAGIHSGKVQTPVAMSAQLDNRPGELALETVDIRIGGGQISGSASLAGTTKRQLTARLRASSVNLDFLMAADATLGKPGIALPAFLNALPNIDLDGQLDFTDLRVPPLAMKQGTVAIKRAGLGGYLAASAQDYEGGSAKVRLEGNRQAGQAGNYRLTADINRVNLPKLFAQQSTLLDTRTSGNIAFSGRGQSAAQVIRTMTGSSKLTIEMRTDGDWQRTSGPADQLTIEGNARTVMVDTRIAGVEISELVVDSLQQNLTGTVSMVDGRAPWLVATLESDKLDIPALLDHFDSNSTASSDSDTLDALKNLGAAQLSLKAKSLKFSGLAMTNVDLQVSSKSEQLRVDRFNFELQKGTFESEGQIGWEKSRAALAVNARVSNLAIDELFIAQPEAMRAPVSGTISLQSEGVTVGELLGGLHGEIELASSAAAGTITDDNRRKISMTARRIPNGMQAEVQSLQWGKSDLSGSLSYYQTVPPRIELELKGGTLSLRSWEEIANKKQADSQHKPVGSIVTRTARASIDMVGDVVLAPLRLITGPSEAVPGDKLFATDTFPLEWLHKYQLKIHGKLDSLDSIEVTGSDLALELDVEGGKLNAQANAAVINQGKAQLKMLVDDNKQPAAVQLSGEFTDIQGPLLQSTAPRSGYFDVSSQGKSQAELAANVNGIVYLQLGAGPLDYGRAMLLTADVATAAFDTLIPGSDKKKPQLECAVALGVFKDGKGITPYGYAARTDLANLVGQVELNLKKELVHMNFSSSSRKGVGISVGNVFSNTIEIEGSLSDPKIIPDATGLIWRGWAAVLTGGLSIVGESVLKRALASENPCESVHKHIRKDLCVPGQTAASSALVCPQSS
jgi:hypothetical protein